MTSSAIKVFFCLLLFSSSGTLALQVCEADHECLEGQFCYKSGRCTSCLDCSIYNRKSSNILKCSKHPLECGYCLPGYEEESFEGGAKRELCVRKNEPEEKINSVFVLMLFGVAIVIGALFGFICVYKKYRAQINADNSKSRQSNSSSRDDIEVIRERPAQSTPLLGRNQPLEQNPDCPPPYLIQENYNPEYRERIPIKSMPWSSAPPEDEITYYAPSIQIEKEIQCRAVPFTPYNKNYSSQRHHDLENQNETVHRAQAYNENNSLSTEEDSQEELPPRTIEPPEIEEDTQQSHWRPMLETNSTQTTNEDHEYRFRSVRRSMVDMEPCGQCSEHCPRNHDDPCAKRLCTETNDCQQTDCLDSGQNEIPENSPNIEETDFGGSSGDNFNDKLDD